MVQEEWDKYMAAGGKKVSFIPNYNCRQIFMDEHEQILAQYFTTAAKYDYGLSPTEARNLAMEFAMWNGKYSGKLVTRFRCWTEVADWLHVPSWRTS